MINEKTAFEQLKKKSAQSFNQQKTVIKNVMAGKTVNCPQCGQALQLNLPNESELPGIACKQGCTTIALDFC